MTTKPWTSSLESAGLGVPTCRASLGFVCLGAGVASQGVNERVERQQYSRQATLLWLCMCLFFVVVVDVSSYLWLCMCLVFRVCACVCVSPSLLLFCCCARVSFFVVVHASYFLWLCMGLLFLVVHVSWPPLRLYSTCLLCFCQYGSGLLLTM